MSEFLAFAELGIRHILDPNGLDHILFLIALAAIYRLREWREVLWVSAAFTVGHSVTLGLAATDTIRFPTGLIEFLIPVTIVATAVGNLVQRDSEGTERRRKRHRLAIAALFGLVHGAGFANYLRSLFVDEITVPLFGFNVGIELGQILVLVVVTVLLALLDAVLGKLRLPLEWPSPHRLRILGVSSLVGLIALGWSAQRMPW